MAWGYWSASTVLPDRGRSPRRAGSAVTQLTHQHVKPNPPTPREVIDDEIINTPSTSRDSRDHSNSPHSSSNGAANHHHHEIRHAVPASALFGESYGELSRRPSLDLGSVRSVLASCSGGGTLSAGSTLNRGVTLADYLPPPTPCPHHHRVYVDHHTHYDYEQPIQVPHVGVSHSHTHSRASSRHHTDEEDDLEPAYATGMSIIFYKFP